MSAYMEFKTIQFTNPVLLKQALDSLGLKHEMGANLPQVGGRQVQVVVERGQAGSLYNWGFAWDGRSFNLVVNDYDANKALGKAFRDKLCATYSKLAVAKLLLDTKAAILETASGPGGTMIKVEVQI